MDTKKGKKDVDILTNRSADVRYNDKKENLVLPMPLHKSSLITQHTMKLQEKETITVLKIYQRLKGTK